MGSLKENNFFETSAKIIRKTWFQFLFLAGITGLGYVVSGERIQRGRDTDLSVKMRFSKRINASSTLLYPDLILALGVG